MAEMDFLKCFSAAVGSYLIALALFLLFSVFKYLYRDKYILIIVKRKGTNPDRLLMSCRYYIRFGRIFIWFSPLFFTMVSVGLYHFLRFNIFIAIAFPGLMILYILFEYLFQNSLCKFLTQGIVSATEQHSE